MGAVPVAAAVSTFVYLHNERNSMDELFWTNVEALAQSEALGVETCYIDDWTGEYDYALFCSRSTSDSYIYPCSKASEMHGFKSKESKCYK